jgi:uncharacterized oxidoreductase
MITILASQNILSRVSGHPREARHADPKQPHPHHGRRLWYRTGSGLRPPGHDPTYCATKAALHAYTQSLRYQLKGTTTEVLELIPPYVATDLMNGASDPRAMPLGAFIAEVMAILEGQPDATEVCVENVRRLRFAAEAGNYEAMFQGFNDAMAQSPH